MKVDKILFGAAYYDEYMPYDRIDEDMAMMQKAGINTIRIAESTWSTLEPYEGVYDFTHLDRMITAAKNAGINVIVGTPTYAIPTWLNAKADDILAITHDGQQIYGHRQNMDITHPIYLKYAEKIIRVLIEHVCNEPNVIGYQLDNETKAYDTAGPGPQKLFVEYLKKQYPDINAFNLEFGLDYWSNRVDSWDVFPDIRGTINQSLAAEYEKFQRNLVTQFFEWQADIINEYKRPDQFITHNFDFAWTDHSCGMQPDVNQYEASKCMTVAGADIYHPSQDSLTGAEITVCGNIIRSLKQDNYLILETQAQGNAEWLHYPGQLRLCGYSHIANGANSVMYWHWHSLHNAIESYWKGILSHDFGENATYRDVCELGLELNKYGDRIKNLKKRNKAAIMIDNASQTGMKLFPLKSHNELSYNAVMRWIADAMYKLNIEFDMIPSNYENLSDYELICIPALYSAKDETLQRIDSYVREGGNVLVTFKSAFSNEHIKIYHDTQPHGLTECLGIRYDQFTVPKNASMTMKLDESFLSAVSEKGVDDSLTLNIHDWLELVTPTTASPLAGYDNPYWKEYAAVTENSYGKGHGYYLSCFFDEKGMMPLIRHICNTIGLKLPDIEFPIICKKGTNDFEKEVKFYFNYSSDKQNFVYHGETATDIMTGKIINDGNVIELNDWDLAILEIQ